MAWGWGWVRAGGCGRVDGVARRGYVRGRWSRVVRDRCLDFLRAQGHNPDPNGLMRNTEKDPNNPDRKKNSRLKEDDKVTQKEVCILCNKAGLKEADCCTYKKKSAAIVLPTRSTIVSSVSQIAGDYVT